MYAYTYEGAMKKFAHSGHMLIKIGDSHRDVDVRMNEQGGAAEYEGKLNVGSWNNLKKIKRDFDVHKILTKSGLHHQDGKGTEWFKIPATTLAEARVYIDSVITKLEGRKVRKKVALRSLQSKALAKVMDYIEQGGSESSIIANLCPRFGKTIWALSLFNELTAKYHNRVMLLPAYWLSAHTSFDSELEEYDDFLDMRVINTDDPHAPDIAKSYLEQGLRIVVPISLHGEFLAWKIKHAWVSQINNDDIFMFADEGDFGTHTESQGEKLAYLFDEQLTEC